MTSAIPNSNPTIITNKKRLVIPLLSGSSCGDCGSIGEAVFTGVVDSGVSKAPSESELLHQEGEKKAHVKSRLLQISLMNYNNPSDCVTSFTLIRGCLTDLPQERHKERIHFCDM